MLLDITGPAINQRGTRHMEAVFAALSNRYDDTMSCLVSGSAGDQLSIFCDVGDRPFFPRSARDSIVLSHLQYPPDRGVSTAFNKRTFAHFFVL